VRNKISGVLGTACAVTAAGVLSMAVLAGCGGIGTPALSECAMVTNGGFGSGNQGITHVVHPGYQVNYGNGETPWYYPCNARNFATAKEGGDRNNPLAVRTAASGPTPGMPVYIWSTVYFTANQNNTVMNKFLSFCLKYGCATNDAQVDASISSSAHSSNPGWENMLLENMGPAVDRASETAVTQFGPDLWRTQSNWDQLGKDIAAGMNAQLAVETGSAVPYFCGDAETATGPAGGSGPTAFTCPGMTVVVSSVTPQDPAVVTAYNQEVQAEQSAAANAARLTQAKLLYGPYAQYFLGIQDTAADCPRCAIYIGNPGSVPAAAGGK
jgi:hypothetical protein